MNILVTGSKGFVGKNLVATLQTLSDIEVLEFHRGTMDEEFEEFCKKANFVFHLAGVNRPQQAKEFMEGNYDLTHKLLSNLKKHKNYCPVMISSSIQAELANPYGLSKKAGEELVEKYSKETGAKSFIYRFPNLFGKWSKPYYNTVIATFCHKIARNEDITVNDPDTELHLAYIDDVVKELIDLMFNYNEKTVDNCVVPVSYHKTLKEIVYLLQTFKNSRDNKTIPNMNDSFTKKLYSTYLSFLPTDNFNYPLKMNVDNRGSFTEFIKTPDRGQVSVNISKPGITKGNHWHHTKNEKFLVVSGTGVIRFRHLDSKEIIEYYVSGDKLEVIDIPVGYTHNIENLGQNDMVTIMWVNEIFDPDEPDTYFLEV